MSKRHHLSSLAVLAVLAGCTTSTEPRYPSIEGEYTGFVDMAFSNTQEEQTGTGSITLFLDEADSDGDFIGTFEITGVAGASGPLSGFVDANGNVTITQFGDADPDVDFSYLQDLFWWCDFSTVNSNSFSGFLDGPDLTIEFLENVSCYYGEPATAYDTDIDYEITVAR
jgi:hypothetical protein